jgi:hypothetical protein
MGRPGRRSRDGGMKWRVVLELVGADGTAGIHKVGGGAVVVEYTPWMIGLTLAEGKHMLAMSGSSRRWVLYRPTTGLGRCYRNFCPSVPCRPWRRSPAGPGPTHHVLDWFHPSMRVQHVAQAARSWSGARLAEPSNRSIGVFGIVTSGARSI